MYSEERKKWNWNWKEVANRYASMYSKYYYVAKKTIDIGNKGNKKNTKRYFVRSDNIFVTKNRSSACLLRCACDLKEFH